MTIGQTAADAATASFCGGGTTYVEDAVGAPPEYTIPAGGGVITSWSVQARNASGDKAQLKLVSRASPATSFTVVAQDTTRTLTPNVLNQFSTRLPVSGGEILASWVPSSGGPCDFNAGGGDHERYLSGTHPEPGIGETFATDTDSSGVRVNIAARLEADCDHDGLGDETQDPDTSSCNPPAGPTGQRAAALRRCKKRAHKHHWSHKRLKKCRKKAKKLPV